MENSTLLTPISIKQTGPQELAIEWSDHHLSFYPTYELRLACRCATCVDEWTGTARIQKDLIPLDVHPVTMEGVGRYGFRINWSDGHNTGIYTFQTLREICGCEQCKKLHKENK